MITENTVVPGSLTETEKKQRMLRCAVRSNYQMQQLRIQIGNRIVASFRNKLGIYPSQSEDKASTEAKELLDEIREEYYRITDGIAKITKNTKIGDKGKLISDIMELHLLNSYEMAVEAEKMQVKAIEDALESFPIWAQWLKGVNGCGTLMSGAIISEIDITKCNNPSSIICYAGLDVVITYDDEGNILTEEGRGRKSHHLVPKVYVNREGKETHTVGLSHNPMIKSKMIGVLAGCFLKRKGVYSKVYYDYKNRINNMPKHQSGYYIIEINADKKQVGTVLSERTLTSEELKKQCIKMNKALGKGAEPIYTIRNLGKSDKHRHNMAMRYMIKEFLYDLWYVWRTLEGLPIRPRYSEEKLGIVHSEPCRVKQWIADYHAKQIKQ